MRSIEYQLRGDIVYYCAKKSACVVNYMSNLQMKKVDL